MILTKILDRLGIVDTIMKKLFFFLFAFLFSLSPVINTAFAQENTTNRTLAQDQTINGDYFMADDTVALLGTVNGDAYVAGGTVTIDGTVEGDVIATGGTITVNGSAQNVRVAGGTVHINGTVEKNVTALGGTVIIGEEAEIAGSIVTAGGTINILAPIGKGATIGGGTVVINNAINGDVNAGVGQLTLQPQAQINGNLTYTSDQKAQIMQGASVSGETRQMMPPKPEKENQQEALFGLAGVALFFKLMGIVSLLVLGLLLVFLAPHYLKRTAHTIIGKPWQSLGVGVVSLILAPIIFVILLMTILGIPLAFLFIILFTIACYFAKLFVIYLIGEKVGTSINGKLHMAWLFVIGLIIYEIIVLIPIVGWLVELAALIFGLGALLMQKKYLYQKLRKDKTV